MSKRAIKSLPNAEALNRLRMRVPDTRGSSKPPLKWAGGKRWLIPTIAPYWQRQSNRRLVELFCGGLAAALGLRPEIALLNDINPHLINFYKWVKNGLVINIDARYEKHVYYRHRDRFNQLIRERKTRSKEAAQLFYFLNRTGYNGLCRFNLSGEFNVPFGSFPETLRYADNFLQYRSVFRAWEFTNLDFAAVPFEDQDFIYADPPYDVEFTTYSSGGFSWDDQVRLAQLLSVHPGPVILSNQATGRIIDLYSQLGFRLEYHKAPRRISCNGDRTVAREVLAFKNI